ncbi:hypothetical protein SAMN04244553_0788 [Nocardia amikacinitolerans]|uniref:Extracellular solute-binding protein n=1 Tax=Nocardia amikacinitolerans TaxID=756689 RepID=A0A285KVI8_9NOCA|nr:hypothetical protein [Nocardia amikacinitolerans]SNY76672.1 hypothetical protein SAMN04244553_0788 [Nocardia amikacinitolerans]
MAVDTVREEQAIRRLTDSLVENYTETHSAEQIQTAIGSARQRFDGRPVREFVPILVERIVRRELEPESAEAPTERVAVAPATSERPDLTARLRQFPRNGKLALLGGALAVVALLVVVLVMRQPDPAPSAASTPALTTVHGVVGSEKMAFFEDPRVVEALARHGLKAEVEPAGSRQIASIDLANHSFAFPSSAPAAERIQRARNVATKYTPFASPMAIATFRPIADLLTAAGVVRPGPVSTFDMARYLELVGRNTEWAHLPDNTAYPVRKNILVSTTDPRTSNSAAMYLAIAGFVANDRAVVQGAEAEKRVLPIVSRLFTGQGYAENSSAGPFQEYLTAGMGPTPLVMIYEAQFVEAAVQGQLKPDMVLTYPSPTVLSTHTLVPLDESGDRLGRLLSTDPELQRLAAEHGFRTGDAAQFAQVTAENKVPVPANLIDVVDAPTFETMEHLLDGVTQSYN